MATPSCEVEVGSALDDATDDAVHVHISKRRRIEYEGRDHSHGRAVNSLKALSHDQYTVGWICALPTELAAARAMLDDEHEGLSYDLNDNNTYTLGNIGPHHIAIACLPSNAYGTNNAAAVAKDMDRSFPCIRTRLMVGIGGGAPTKVDVRLGDVVVSTEVVQYDMGKTLQEGRLHRTATPRKPPHAVMTAVSKLQANHSKEPNRISSIVSESLEQGLLPVNHVRQSSFQDRLFDSSYEHVGPGTNCDHCDPSRLLRRNPRDNNNPKVHYGVIASSNQVMRHAKSRDRLAEELGVLCFEMEAAGLMDNFPCLVIRGICDYSDSHKNKEWQKYAAAVAAAYAKELLQVMNPNDIHKRTDVTLSTLTGQALQDQRQALLKSLMFEQMDSRETNIKNPHTKTCEWFLQHSDYNSWLDPASYHQSNGFLWIKGKPGAGKSTLMKFIHSRTKKARQLDVVASFFFNARGDQLEKSTEGMYRSVLLQILEKLPALQEVLDDPELVSRYNRPAFTWTTVTLCDLFSNTIKRLGQQSLTCFIDALDECDEDQVQEMIDHFQHLGECAAEANTKLYICFSSRHYPHIEVSNGLEIVLEYQDGHGKDLEKYVQNKLKAGSIKFAKEIRETILQKAAGVFMWVVLVVDIINKEIRKGCPSTVRKRLAALPPKLSDLFKKILQRDNDDMDCVLFSIQLILYAKRPLTREEFYFAVLCNEAPDEALIPWEPEFITTTAMSLRVLSSSKGLAEVTRSKGQTVQFIHESVRDFLIKENGLKALWPNLPEDISSISHDRIKQCCHAYMKANISKHVKFEQGLPNAKSEAGKQLRQAVSQSFPFLEYATCSILNHADMAGLGLPQDSFLQSFDLESWINLRNLFEKHQVRHYTSSASLSYILADNGLTQLMSLQRVANPINKERERYHYPLIAALAHGHQDTAICLLQLGHGLARNSVISQVDSRRDKIDMENAALFCGTAAGLTRVVQFLIDCGTDVDLVKDVRTIPHFSTFYQRGVPKDYTKTPLLLASEQGHIGIVQLLLQHDANVDLANENGLAPLLSASKNGQEGIVQLLLQYRANVNLMDKDGWTPLLSALENGHEGIMQLLLQHGANVDGANVDGADVAGRAPLLWFSQHGHEGIVQLLLQHGANVDVIDFCGRTPLLSASENGRTGTVQLLLQHGANVDAADVGGRTPLLLASDNGRTRTVQLLLQHGANVDVIDFGGRTPLLSASENGRIGIVQLLLQHGANVDAADVGGRTPLLLALKNGHIVQLLLQHGANVYLADEKGNSPLSLALRLRYQDIITLFLSYNAKRPRISTHGSELLMMASQMGHQEVVHQLLHQGVDPNRRDKHGTIALHAALDSSECSRIVRLLLDFGADIRQKSTIGRSLLSAAVSKGRIEIMKLLLEEGADVNERDEGFIDGVMGTALIAAIIEQDTELVQLLLENGAQVSAEDEVGRTALSYACERRNTDIVQLLLDRGAEVNTTPDEFGETPLSSARKLQREKIVHMLLDKGAIDV